MTTLPKLSPYESLIHFKNYLKIRKNTFNLYNCTHRFFELRIIDYSNKKNLDNSPLWIPPSKTFIIYSSKFIFTCVLRFFFYILLFRDEMRLKPVTRYLYCYKICNLMKGLQMLVSCLKKYRQSASSHITLLLRYSL